MSSLRALRGRRFTFCFVLSFLLALWGPRVAALEVTAGSPCSTFCIDRQSANVSDPVSSSTFSRDLSCLDSSYNGQNSTAVGRKFRMCVSCEQTSTATGPGPEGQNSRENDVYWFLCECFKLSLGKWRQSGDGVEESRKTFKRRNGGERAMWRQMLIIA